jgi:formylglycine-generating enzyme required for sulfatase activity
MALIPAGTFQMGDSKGDGYADELPLHTVTLDSFYIGKYEVTNGQYCQYLNSALGQGLITVTSGLVYQAGSGTSYPYCDTSTSSSDSQIVYSDGVFSVGTKGGRDMSNDPMVQVSWYGSVAYCNWRSQQEGKEQCYDLSTWECDFTKHGYRLPTEAEWEYAARGGLSGKRFPWGDTITHSQANYYSNSSYSYDISPTRGYHPAWNDGVYPFTSPVGSFSANGYGLCDMTGNVWEWGNDWYGSYSSSPQTNPTGPTSGSYRVLRGGSWYGLVSYYCRVAFRGYYFPNVQNITYGFRVVLVGESPTTVTIWGTVYNAASNTTTIPDADVTANGTTVKTDAGGQYQITDLPPGDITVTVNKVGYVQNITTVFCPEPGHTYQIDFGLYADVELIGLEVVQTIQNWQNDVLLIEGKKTYVRAHVKSKSNPPMSVKAGLRVKRNGEILQSEQNFVATCTAEPDPQRQWSNSLNFELKPEWCSGTLELTVIGEGIECSETAGPIAGDCSAQVTFIQSPKLKVVVFDAPWRGLDMQLHTVDSTELQKAGAALLDIYPINNLNSLDIKTDSLPPIGPIIPNGDIFKMNTNVSLNTKWCLDCWQSGECSSLYYGVTPDIQAGGKAAFSGLVASGEAARYVMAHELGHCLGRPHSTNNWVVGPCWELAMTTEIFPYIYNINGQMRATMGYMDLGENRLIYGLDTSSSTPIVQYPNINFELMSYCDPGNRWISDYTYERILIGINTKFGSSTRMQHAESRTSETQCYLVVRGMVNFDNNTAELSPFTYISNPIVVPSEPNIGDYTLELLDGSDHLIISVNFQPMEYTVDSSEDSRFGSFIIPVPADPNIKRAIVIHDANAIGSITASNNPPTVQVLSPNGGEVFDGNQLTIEWIGNDLDGDNLTYVVNYSSDGGGTWKTIAVDWPDPNLTIERKFIKATNMGLIRVIASDGFNTATDESDSVFTVLNNAPEVVLFRPETNAIFDANQPILFEASALDREDGRLNDSNLVWTSSIDGSLGTGSVLTRDSNSLSRGYHTITVTATDSGGLTASTSVNIWVGITPADLTGNSKVDFIDYAILANQWQLPPGTPSADIAPPPTGDGIVNLQDLALMAEYWLTGF